MPVDISDILHVLAHELRTPSGIAQGYVRMLLEDRLTADADRRRALEQIQQALARVSELTRESSRLAEWYQREPNREVTEIALDDLLARATEDLSNDPRVRVRSDERSASAMIASPDTDVLAGAVMAIIKATTRELRNIQCTIEARVNEHSSDLLIGRDDQLASLAVGPTGEGMSPLALDRGGIGLTLFQATAVLDAHGATTWTAGTGRNLIGIRFPLIERPLQ